MKRIAPLALALLGLAGCPDSKSNAPRLWLYLQGGETDVQLVDYEPPPF